jgi:hypothetical protein
MESSAQEETNRPPSRPSASLPPIREARSSLESAPQSPTVSSVQDSPRHTHTPRQRSVEIVSGFSSPGPSRETKQHTPIQLNVERQGEVPITDDIKQGEDVIEESPGRLSKEEREKSADNSTVNHERERQTDLKIKKLAWEKRVNNEDYVRSFDQLQLLLLFHAQHDLVLQLDKFDSRKRASREQIRSQLHRYSVLHRQPR